MTLFHRSRSPVARRARLRVEQLEARDVPAAPAIPLNNFGNQGFSLRGFEDGAVAGESVSAAGDVNGDGYGDLIVGARYTESGGTDRGAAYVVFGGPGRGGQALTLNALANNGFTIRGFESSSQAGDAVAAAGDVNGDGYGDLIVGARLADAGGTNRGEAYVVFGGPNRAGTTLTLGALGTNGFTMRGFEDNANAGWSVAGGRDMNGDGFADVIVGAPNTDAGGTNRGEVYVVYGGPTRAGTTVTLNALGGGGFTLRGFENEAAAGAAVANAGDVNGDGHGDVVIGSLGADAGGGFAAERGEAYVMFPHPFFAGQVFALNNLPFIGFTIRGFENTALLGHSVGGAGDVNGDGFSDVIIGAYFTNAGGTDRGEAYVVFGHPNLSTSTFTANALGTHGFTVRGFDNGANLGASVSGAGDVNGDGLDDVIVGGPNTDLGNIRRGAAYVVYGGVAGGTTLNPEILGASGFSLDGFENDAHVGVSVAGAGDVNGDGLADLIVGAPETNSGGTNRGAAYVVSAPLSLYAVGSDSGTIAQVVVYDGRTHRPRGGLLPYGAFNGGARVATAEVNNDGAPDIIVGSGPGPAQNVKVYDGRTLALLHEFSPYGPGFTGGVYVAGGDVNGDGKADVLTAAGPGGGPHVRVVSSATWTDLFSFFAFPQTFTGGAVVAAGDVNGDGRADILTAAGPTGGPHVKAFSGVNLSELLSFFAFDPVHTLGMFISSGDVTGDGRDDVVVGLGGGWLPQVKVFSHTGALVHSFLAYSNSFNGGVRVAAVDADGDGRAEVITGAGAHGSSHVRVRRGTNLAELHGFFAFDPASSVGGVYVG